MSDTTLPPMGDAPTQTAIAPFHETPQPVITTTLVSPSPFVFPRPNDEQVKNAAITIVDDDAATTVAIRKHLELAGFSNFDLVTDSHTAFDRMKKTRPDLVILDLIMPVSGATILEQIRRCDATCNIAVLTLTSKDDEETRAFLLNLGANDFLVKPVSETELVARVRNTLSSKIAFDLLSLHTAQLQVDALRDPLTGVANRRAFDFEFNRKMIEWERQRIPVSLMLLDIDYFKQVNDTFGHDVGDNVIRHVAETIQASIRSMDLLCRIGGEEFAVILPVSQTDQASQTAERIRKKVADTTLKLPSGDISVTVSIGVAHAKKGDDVSLLLRRADTALYAGKQRGRDMAIFHDGTRCITVAQTQTKSNDEVQRSLPSSLETNVTASSVMVIDDEPSTVVAVKKHLQQGGFDRVTSETDSTNALRRILAEKPDLVLMDYRMPHTDGLTLLEQMRSHEATQHTPVVFVTSTKDTDTKVKALNLGANDFLHKPVNSSELIARVRNTLLAKAHVDLLGAYSAKLEYEVQLRTTELVASRREAIQCLARAAEIRDDKTGQHVLRVGRYAAIIAHELGFPESQIVDLEHAAQLHDVGKIGVRDAILNKPDELTPAEFEEIKEHCRTGSRIIRDDRREDEARNSIGQFLDGCTSPVMRLAALVAETHHEKWDGSGYPRGLAGEDIPIEGRITAVCDVFDAVSTARPYKPAFPLDTCLQIIRDGSGSHFDPMVVNAFFRRKDEIIATLRENTSREF